jgi:hypothetical protein
MRGVKGHRLESLAVGGKRFVSDASFVRWVAAINSAKSVPNPSRETSRRRTRELLRAAGLIEPPMDEAASRTARRLSNGRRSKGKSR